MPSRILSYPEIVKGASSAKRKFVFIDIAGRILSYQNLLIHYSNLTIFLMGEGGGKMLIFRRILFRAVTISDY